MIEAELIDVLDVGNTLGEGALWRETDQSVWWTDIEERRLFRLSWPSGSIKTYEVPERLCSFGFIAGDDSRLVCAFESGFAVFQPEIKRLEWLARPAELSKGRRLNDGRVARDGSFWAGSMLESGGDKSLTGLYCLKPDGTAERMISGIEITNGLCWSPDGARMYFSDSRSGQIFECEPGRVVRDAHTCKVFARVSDGSPDGAVVDNLGRYWSAIWGGGHVRCYAPDGEELARLPLPAHQPTSLAFGGSDLNLIFVTSARAGMGVDMLNLYPKSGSLFVFKTNACGSRSFRYCLKA